MKKKIEALAKFLGCDVDDINEIEDIFYRIMTAKKQNKMDIISIALINYLTGWRVTK